MSRSLYPVKRRDHQLISKTEHTHTHPHTHTHTHTHIPEFIWILGGMSSLSFFLNTLQVWVGVSLSTPFLSGKIMTVDLKKE